jgi:hypothetical protein
MNGDEFKRQTEKVRSALKAENIGSEFHLRVKADGRIQDGEVLITYELSDSVYYAASVQGDSLEAVLDEFIRRHTWNARHLPLAISAPPPAPDADTPF